VTLLVHARYFVTILRAVFLKGSTIVDLAVPTLALVLYATVIIWIAGRAFRKRLD
jgi:ABC-2 type transport system permease protein